MTHGTEHPLALVVGEAIVDVVSSGGMRSARAGGSPLNVAIGLQRLGLTTVLHSQIGDDANGELIARHLDASGVSVTPTTRGAGATSVALAELGADGSAHYDFSVEWDPAPVEDRWHSDALVAHTGSIGAVLEPGATFVEHLLAGLRSTSTITFDPNIRPQVMGDRQSVRKRVERLVALADVVKASDEDLRWLYPERSTDAVLGDWLDRGPGLVVVTRGVHGADARIRSGAVHVSAHSATVADTIGAGDSFMAGLVVALADANLLGAERREALREIDRAALVRALEFASACAAITVSRRGADPPTRAERTASESVAQS